MIREEAEPNTESPTEDKESPTTDCLLLPDKSAKKLMSADKLKQLSNLFNNKDD